MRTGEIVLGSGNGVKARSEQTEDIVTFDGSWGENENGG